MAFIASTCLAANTLPQMPTLLEQPTFVPSPGEIPLKYKGAVLNLPITLLAFEKTYNAHRLLDELNKVNEIYAQCGIQLNTKIQARIFSSENLSLYWVTWMFGTCEKDNTFWGIFQRQYANEGIPITYLLSDTDGYENLGQSQLRESTRFSSNNLEWKAFQEATFPRYAVYLADYTKIPFKKTGHKYENGIVTLAHELGHLILDEGHNSDLPWLFLNGNLMADFAARTGYKTSERSRATALTEKQCHPRPSK